MTTQSKNVFGKCVLKDQSALHNEIELYFNNFDRFEISAQGRISSMGFDYVKMMEMQKKMMDENFLKFINSIQPLIMKTVDSFKDKSKPLLFNLGTNLSSYLSHAFYFIYRVATSSSLTDLMVSVTYIIANVVTQESERRRAESLLGIYQTAVRTFWRKYSKIKVQASDVDKNSDYLRMFVDSSFYKSVKTLLLGLVSLKFLPYQYAQTFIKTIGVPEPKCMIDVFIDMIDSIESLFKHVKSGIEKGSISAILFNDDRKAIFIDKAMVLINKYSAVYFGSEENFLWNDSMQYRISHENYLLELSNCITIGKRLREAHKSDLIIRSKLSTLERLYSELLLRISSTSRRPPMGIILHGDPQIGKSSISKLIYKTFAKVKGYEYSDDLIFDRNRNSEYWDQYDPIAQPIIHMGELGSKNKNLAAKVGCSATEELLNLMDTAPYPVNIAKAEDKGKIFAMPQLVFSDVNDPDLNLNVIMNNPAAVRRRFLWIEAKVKDKFKQDNSVALDEEKVRLYADDPYDLWHFSIYLQLPKDIKSSEKKYLITDTDVFGMLQVVKERMELHNYRNDAFMDILETPIDKYLEPRVQNYTEVIGVSQALQEDQSWFSWLLQIFLSLYAIKCLLSLLKVDKTYFAKIIHQIRIVHHRIICKVYFMYMQFHNQQRITLFLEGFAMCCFVLGVCSFFFKGTKSIPLQGNFIDSSGQFDEDNYEDKCKEVEIRAEATFPKPKKKSGTDKDYDKIESFVPTLISDKRNFNKPDEVFNSIIKNLRYIRVKKITPKGEKWCRSRVVGIYGSWVLVNRHVIIDAVELHMSNCEDFAMNKRVRTVKKDHFIECGNDICLWNTRCESFHDIRYTMIPDYTNEYIEHSARYWNSDSFNKRAALMNKDAKVYDPINQIDHVINPFWQLECENFDGLCGYPLVVVINKQTFFVGIHVGGTELRGRPWSFVTAFRKKDILSLIPHENDFQILSQGSFRLKKDTYIGEVHKGSPLLYEDVENISVIGGLHPLRVVSPKSQLILTPLVSEIEDLLGVSPKDEKGRLKYGIPKMHRKSIGGTHGPYNIWLRKVNVEKKCIEIQRANAVTDNLVKYFLDKLPKEDIKPYNFYTAQNGSPENFYVRPMKNATSGGFLFPGKKRNYLIDTPTELKPDGVLPNYDVTEQFLEIVDSYCNECNSNTILGAQLKDEPRPMDKCVQGKTRVFAMSGYDKVLVDRMFAMPFYSLMSQYSSTFRVGIGFNMHGQVAHDMYKDILTFKNYFGGDYGGYDTSMPVDVGYECNRIVYRFLRDRGYNEYSLKILKGVLSDNLFPVLAIDGSIIQIPGFQPSGKYATAEDNSLRGLYLLYYFFSITFTEIGRGHPYNRCVNFKPNDFFKYTRVYIYGDDLIGSVSDTIKEFFNNKTYAVFCKEIYGMEFTNPDKGEHTENFLKKKDISFLKRNFRWHKGLNRYVAALDISSCVKTLTWVLKSNVVSVEVQIIESMISVNRELFFHIDDEQQFMLIRKKFIDCAEKHFHFGYIGLEEHFPTWNKLINDLSN